MGLNLKRFFCQHPGVVFKEKITKKQRAAGWKALAQCDNCGKLVES